jgi:hypothetical protein
MDKFPDIVKATIAAFHGIVATWIFREFSATEVTEFYFVILVIFFGVVNATVWHILIRFVPYLRSATEQNAVDLTISTYRPLEVAVLTAIAVITGSTAAYVQNHDLHLRMANKFTSWERSSNRLPFEMVVWRATGRFVKDFDRRDPSLIKKDGQVLLRVYINDAKLGYEGYVAFAPSKGEVREVILSPACRFTLTKDSDGPVSWQRIDGPGVFLGLTDTTVIEILDEDKSKCAQPQ